jgi:hypothetical protein
VDLYPIQRHVGVLVAVQVVVAHLGTTRRSQQQQAFSTQKGEGRQEKDQQTSWKRFTAMTRGANVWLQPSTLKEEG